MFRQSHTVRCGVLQSDDLVRIVMWRDTSESAVLPFNEEPSVCHVLCGRASPCASPRVCLFSRDLCLCAGCHSRCAREITTEKPTSQLRQHRPPCIPLRWTLRRHSLKFTTASPMLYMHHLLALNGVANFMFCLLCRDLQGNNLTIVHRDDLRGLRNLRVLWVPYYLPTPQTAPSTPALYFVFI